MGEALNPRDTLVDGLRALGGSFDRDTRVWCVPDARASDLRVLLERYRSAGGRVDALALVDEDPATASGHTP